MITLVTRFITKDKKFVDFKQLVKLMTETTHKDDAGCLFYEFYQEQAKNNEYMLYEIWKDRISLENHLERLRQLLGPVEPSKILSKKTKRMLF